MIEQGHNIPVIFITGYDTPESREQANQVGAVGYFSKPIDDQALLDTINWALSKCKELDWKNDKSKSD